VTCDCETTTDNTFYTHPLSNALFVGGLGLVAFLLALFPTGDVPAPLGNAYGAISVALGGICGALSAYNHWLPWTRPLTWTLVVIGGAIIAGASLQMAIWPRP
jgi:peptidoglycan/LPS O-acetylase OafA/YrhL